MAQTLTDAARALRDIPAASARAAFRSVNKIAAKANTQVKRTIASQVMLPASYVADKLSLQQANLNNPTAIITGRRRPTTLASYGAKLLRNGKKPGVSVKVSRQGPRKVLKKAFLLTLKAGAEAGSAQGVFMRVGGKLKHLYGPSVDQLFRRIKDEISPQIVMDLSDAFFKQLDYELQRR